MGRPTYYDPKNGGSFSVLKEAPGINSPNPSDSETQFFITPDLKQAYWTAAHSDIYGIVTADLINGTYANMRPVLTPNNFTPPFAGKLIFMGEANITETPQGWVMYLMCAIAHGDKDGKPDDGKIYLCRARKRK
ncbi:MAG: hypothetical protein IPM57_06630 [Oligoflexia bacterium]|nr:hypothetical protein [Oligoflexia bacterium]